MKKKCILIGNCQMKGIHYFLENNKNFNEKYEIMLRLENWKLVKNTEMIIENELKQADLVIYQPLTDVYGCYSTNKNNPDSMINLLSENTITVSVPRIHVNFLWPIYKKASNREIYYGADTIDKLMNNELSKKSILSMYDNYNIDFEFGERVANGKQIFLEKEQCTDIKIFDWIFSNIKKSKILLTQDHPTSVLFHELTTRIFDFIDIPRMSIDCLTIDENIVNLEDSVYHRADCQYPIDMYSYAFFEFEFIDKNIIINNGSHNFYRSILEKYIDTKFI